MPIAVSELASGVRALERARLPEIWAHTLGNPGIIVAVLDGPVDRSHPCFLGVSLSALPTLVSGAVGDGRMSLHGTHVSSMIFAQHSSPVRGISPNCRGLIVPIFSDDQKAPTPQLDLARAINQAVDAGAHVINISGGELADGAAAANPILVNAVRNAKDQGALIVAAAGNDGCQCLHVPAALPGVLGVGAMDEEEAPLESSNWGEAYQSQGVLAPGKDMLGAVPGGGTALKSGTSFAAPVVSGVAALLLSAQLERGEKPDPHAVGEAILASAHPCDAQRSTDCRRILAGRLNIPGAYALISQNGRTSMSDERTTGEAVHANVANQSSQTRGSAIHGQEATEILRGDSQQSRGSIVVAAEVPDGQRTVPGAPAGAAEISPISMDSARGARNGGATAAVTSSSVVASEGCACQGNGGKRIVFAIGSLAYDFGTEARRDVFRSRMPNFTLDDGIPFVPFEGAPPPEKTYPPNPYDARQVVHHLAGYPPAKPPFPTKGGFPRLENDVAFPPPETKPPAKYPGSPANVSDAALLTWILNIELTPIYAIRPCGSFSTEAYQRLVEFLAGQARHPTDADFVSRVSIPGILTNETVTLFTGQVVPVVVPHLGGMYAWNENVLVEAAMAKMTERIKKTITVAKERTDAEEKASKGLRNFLDRIYYDLRNLGQTSAERALNFTATNAFQGAIVFTTEALSDGMELDTILVERSAFCRKDSDCWDVKMRFFDPENDRRARRINRFTVDVSDEHPVLVGPIRTWFAPG